MENGATRASERIRGDSQAVVRLRVEIESLARSDFRSVLVVGETGTGKDLVARALGMCSPDRSPHLEVFNCPAVPADHLESELFGTTRGAFPGSVDRSGAAERAAGGTLFFDEIGAMAPQHQGKILRLLESGEGRRLGATRSYRTDAVVVAATNEDLWEAVTRGTFREDLYYRLTQDGILRVPALRERPEDIPLLAAAFLEEIDRSGVLEPSALDELRRERWPGNVRQLRAVVRNAARLAAPGHRIEGAHVREALARLGGRPTPTDRPHATTQAVEPPGALRPSTTWRPSPARERSFYEAEPHERRRLLIEALRRAGGNQTEAGVALGLHLPRHGAEGAASRSARRLAERKFRYWWYRLVGPQHPDGAPADPRPPAGPPACAGFDSRPVPTPT